MPGEKSEKVVYERRDWGVETARWTLDSEPIAFLKAFGNFPGNVDRWQYYLMHVPSVAIIDFGGAAAGTGARMALLNRGAEKYHECTPCPGAGIKPLTNAKAELTGMIDSLFANDGVYTNIPQGLSWAWRMVTPGPPFTESDDVFNTTDAVGNPMFPREKAVVLLTDGANTRRNGDAYNHARDSQNRRNNRTRDIAGDGGDVVGTRQMGEVIAGRV